MSQVFESQSVNSSRGVTASRPFVWLLSRSLCLALGASFFLPALSAHALTPQARPYYQQAVEAERRKQLDVAEQALRKAISLDPSDYINFIKLASVLNEQGRPNEAINYYQQALSINPNDAMISYSLASVFEQIGQYSKAELAYVKAMQGNPSYQFALMNLARTQIQQKKYTPAITNYKNFLLRYPKHYEARRRLANLYLVTNQNQAAVHEYDTLKSLFPGQFSEEVDLAKALTASNQPEKALEELKAAYSQEGSKAEISEEMGRAHSALGQLDLAIANYKRAYSLNANKEELLLRIADLYNKQQNWTAASEQLQMYLKKHPNNMDVRRQLADAYLNNKQYETALNELNDLHSKTSDPTQQYEMEKDIAFATHMLGDLPAAIERYEGLSQRPEAAADLQLKANLALAYHKSLDYEKAAQLYKQLYYAQPYELEKFRLSRPEIGSDLAAALTALGDSAYKRGDWNAAVSQYGDAALYGNKQDFWPYLGLGNAYYSLNMPEKAYAAYGQVLERNPQNVTARLYRAKLEMAGAIPGVTPGGNSGAIMPVNTQGQLPAQQGLQQPGTQQVISPETQAYPGPAVEQAIVEDEQATPVAQPMVAVVPVSTPQTTAPATNQAQAKSTGVAVSPATSKTPASNPAATSTNQAAESTTPTAAPANSQLGTLEALAKEDPNNAEVLIALGDAYVQQSNSLAAIDVYERALSAGARSASSGTNPLTGAPLSPAATNAPGTLDPTQKTRLLMAIGGQWQKQGDEVQAKSAYERARDINGNLPEVHYNLGIVYNELGELDSSVASYRKALQLNPGGTDARYGLAVTLDKQDKRQEALDEYQGYIKMQGAKYIAEANERIQWLNQQSRTPQMEKQIKVPAQPAPHNAPVRKSKAPVKKSEASPSVNPALKTTGVVQAVASLKPVVKSAHTSAAKPSVKVLATKQTPSTATSAVHPPLPQ